MAARILVIEDNPLNMELVFYTLQAFGYEPIAATTGQAGLDLAREQRPDLILCDVQLPDIDGLTIARTLKADPELKHIPMVGASAYAMQDDYAAAYEAGFDAYLVKPLDFNKLLSTLRLMAKDAGTAPIVAALTDAAPLDALQPRPPDGATILLVDDEPMNLEVKRSLFEPLGYTVKLADNLRSAMELAAHCKPDLILSDVAMPDGDGLEFLREIKSDPALRDIPLILITSERMDDLCRAQGLKLGAAKFLYRPIQMDVLRAEVEQCLRGLGIID